MSNSMIVDQVLEYKDMPLSLCTTVNFI